MAHGNLSTLISALQLNENPLTNKFMYVEELNNADGSFILSTVIQQEVEKNHKVILILCHNTFGHFHSISQKLGYNLIALKESGKVFVIDILDKITNENFIFDKESLKQLYSDIKAQVNIWNNEGVCIIFESFGNLVLADIKQVFTLTGYIRAVALEMKDCSAVCSLHNFQNCSNFKVLSTAIRHFADISVILKELETGKASDVTGHLTLIVREKDYNRSKIEYQYQLQDKTVNVFAPGCRDFL